MDRTFTFNLRVFIPTYRQSPGFWWSVIIVLACMAVWLNAAMWGWSTNWCAMSGMLGFAVIVSSLPDCYLRALVDRE